MRVPQPPDHSSNAGYPAGAGNRGRFFFGYFILAKQKKVTCCRATPGGVDVGFVFDVGLRFAQPNLQLNSYGKFTIGLKPNLLSNDSALLLASL